MLLCWLVVLALVVGGFGFVFTCVVVLAVHCACV